MFQCGRPYLVKLNKQVLILVYSINHVIGV